MAKLRANARKRKLDDPPVTDEDSQDILSNRPPDDVNDKVCIDEGRYNVHIAEKQNVKKPQTVADDNEGKRFNPDIDETFGSIIKNQPWYERQPRDRDNLPRRDDNARKHKEDPLSKMKTTASVHPETRPMNMSARSDSSSKSNSNASLSRMDRLKQERRRREQDEQRRKQKLFQKNNSV